MSIIDYVVYRVYKLYDSNDLPIMRGIAFVTFLLLFLFFDIVLLIDVILQKQTLFTDKYFTIVFVAISMIFGALRYKKSFIERLCNKYQYESIAEKRKKGIAIVTIFLLLFALSILSPILNTYYDIDIYKLR